MIKNSNQEDLCLLILLPANDAARNYCNQIETSLACEIQMETNNIEKGLIYTCSKQQTRIKISRNQNAGEHLIQINPEHDVRNNNELDNSEKKTSLSLLNSLKNLTIEKRDTKTSTNLIKQRRVKINKKLLSSSSPITDVNVPHTFSLWYKKKK